MKLISLIGIAFALVLLSGCVENTGPVSTGVSFKPVQCRGNPGERWHDGGNIQFFKEPTEQGLVVAYYSQVHNVEI